MHGLAMQFLRSDWHLENLSEHDSTRLPAWVRLRCRPAPLLAAPSCRCRPGCAERVANDVLRMEGCELMLAGRMWLLCSVAALSCLARALKPQTGLTAHFVPTPLTGFRQLNHLLAVPR